jgi:hypothetical protein
VQIRHDDKRFEKVVFSFILVVLFCVIKKHYFKFGNTGMVLDVGPCYSGSSLKFSIINIWKLFRNSLRPQSRPTESKSAF